VTSEAVRNGVPNGNGTLPALVDFARMFRGLIGGVAEVPLCNYYTTVLLTTQQMCCILFR
jgi:hypothetical protein